MELPRKTYRDILDLKPCFDPADPPSAAFESPRDCAPLCASDWEGTALDILRADHVDAADRLWVVMHRVWLPATIRAKADAEIAPIRAKADATQINWLIAALTVYESATIEENVP